MNHINEALESFYSDEVEALKNKAKKSLKYSMISGILAVLTFGFLGLSLFASLIFKINPLDHKVFLILIILAIPVFFISVPTSWFLTARSVYLNKKIKNTVDDDLRKKIKNKV
mgnify:CR=1 FL=1